MWQRVRFFKIRVVMFEYKRYKDYKRILYVWPFRTAAINLDISQACNQICIFCDKRIEFLKSKKKPSFWNLDNIKEIKHILGFYPRVTFAGECGEPLLNPHIGSILREVKKVEGVSEISVLTNGMSLTPEVFNEIKDSVDVIRISLNAASREIQNKVAYKSDFDRIIENLEFVSTHRPKHLKLVISFIGMLINIKELKKVSELAHKIGAYKIILQPLCETGSKNIYGQSLERYPDLLKAEWKEVNRFIKEKGLNVYIETCSGFMEILFKNKEHYPEVVDQNGKYERYGKFCPRKGETKNCPSPFFSTFVRFDGNIVPCPSRSVSGDNITFGNIFDIKEPPIVSKSFIKLRKKILNGKLPDFCKHCRMMPNIKIEDFWNKMMNFVDVVCKNFYYEYYDEYYDK